MGSAVNDEPEIRPGSICVLYEGTSMARLVRIVEKDEFNQILLNWWYTVPFLDQGYPFKSVREEELTLLANEMEVIAWVSKG